MTRPQLPLRLLAGSLLLWLALPAAAQEGPAAPKVKSERPRQVQLSWEAIAGVQAYELWRQPVGGKWELVTKLPTDVHEYLDRSGKTRVRYSYKLVGQGAVRVESAPTAAIECLAPFYLRIHSIKGRSAALFVHIWETGFEEWLASGDPFAVSVGEAIGEEDMLADFSTHAVLERAWSEPENITVKWIQYRGKDGRSFKLSSRDLPPPAVYQRKKPKKPKKPKPAEPVAEQPAESTPVGPAPSSTGTKTLKFPTPSLVGELKGSTKRVEWEIENQSELRLNMVCRDGALARHFLVGAGQTHVVKLPRGGNFEVRANAEDNKIVPLEGKFSLAAGKKYRTVLAIRPVKK